MSRGISDFVKYAHVVEGVIKGSVGRFYRLRLAVLVVLAVSSSNLGYQLLFHT